MIYFIRCGDYIKIGTADNPWSRLGTLQTANPSPLKMLAIRPGGGEYEAGLHEAFGEDNVNGEWFRATAELLAFIDETRKDFPHLQKRSAASHSHKARGKPNLLGNLSRFDAAALVANTAIKVREGGHQIVVRHAKVAGEQGILVFIPGFELIDGNLRLVELNEETSIP